MFRYILAFFILLAGCGPTYPKEKVEDSIVKLCKDEHGIDVRARIVGETVGVEVKLEKLVDETLSVNQEAAEVVSDIIGCIRRVVFSTDREIDFYLIRAIDTGPLGVEWTVVSYIDDIKKLETYNISLGEYSQRRLSEMGFNPNHSWGDEFFLEEIRLPDFLAGQIARRISSNFREDRLLSQGFEVDAVQGAFDESRDTFEFSVNAKGQAQSISALKVMLETVVCVLNGYKFSEFGWVQISGLRNHETLLIERATLEKYQHHQIDLPQLKEMSILPASLLQ